MRAETLQTWVITPGGPSPWRSLAEIITHRHLLVFLAVRSLRKIYRRTVLGWLWLFIIPLFPIFLRTLIFGGLLGVTSDGIPYFLFLMAGQLTWDAFAFSLTWATRGLELHGSIQDVYVPRVIMPLGAMAPAFVDFAIKCAVLVATIGYYVVTGGTSYIVFGPQLLLGVAALAVAMGFAVALSLFTSVWAETARDIRFALGQVLAIWFLLTPVLYPMSAVPAGWRPWLLLNPLAAVTSTFKYALFGIGDPNLPAFAGAAAITMVLLGAGLWYFARYDAAVVENR